MRDATRYDTIFNSQLRFACAGLNDQLKTHFEDSFVVSRGEEVRQF